MQQRRLAGAIRPDQRVHFAAAHAQVRMVGGRQPAEALDQIFYLQQHRHARLRANTPVKPRGAASTTSSSTAPTPNCQWMV